MIELRDMTPADSEMVLRWRNLPEVAQHMYTDHAISPEEHARWFPAALADPTRRYWIIRSADRDLGVASLNGIDRHNSRTSWAFYLAARGFGLGALVEYEVICHVFDHLELNKLCCEVLATNHGVLKLHLTFGFTQEGVLRQHIRKGDQFHDVVCFGLLRAEWQAKRPELEAKLGRVKARAGDAR